jgi:hypothetical protein
MEKIDWHAFRRRYNGSSVEKRIEMILSHLQHFDTRPNWVESYVLSRAVKAERKR